MHRLTGTMLFASAAYVAAGGYIHVSQWLDEYRFVPTSAPGAALVRLGFPVNGALSLVLAVVLVAAAVRLPRLVVPAVVATMAFQAASLAFVVASRIGTVLGWSEPVWTTAAEQTRAVEIGALLTLSAALVLHRSGRLRRRSRRASAWPIGPGAAIGPARP